MARYTGPKHRLARSEGFNVLEKASSSLERRLNIPPGQHGPRGRRRRLTDFGVQLREKQKVKRIYGILERQFRRYVMEAQKKKGDTGIVLLSLLERRLDNTLYRLRLAKTRAFARQLVTHGHVIVSDRKMTIPSYQVRKGDIITLTSKACEIPIVKEALKDRDVSLPAWLERKGLAARIKAMPSREDTVAAINEQLLVEFYSR